MIIRCDWEPSNVLLDNEMTTHASDSGLARLVSRFCKGHANQFILLAVKCTTGYATPGTTHHEFASSGILTQRGDGIYVNRNGGHGSQAI